MKDFILYLGSILNLLAFFIRELQDYLEQTRKPGFHIIKAYGIAVFHPLFRCADKARFS